MTFSCIRKKLTRLSVQLWLFTNILDAASQRKSIRMLWRWSLKRKESPMSESNQYKLYTEAYT